MLTKSAQYYYRINIVYNSSTMNEINLVFFLYSSIPTICYVCEWSKITYANVSSSNYISEVSHSRLLILALVSIRNRGKCDSLVTLRKSRLKCGKYYGIFGYLHDFLKLLDQWTYARVHSLTPITACLQHSTKVGIM